MQDKDTIRKIRKTTSANAAINDCNRARSLICVNSRHTNATYEIKRRFA